MQECVEWAVKGGADFILGETYQEFGEAMLALEAIKQYGKGIVRLCHIRHDFIEFSLTLLNSERTLCGNVM